MDTRPPPPVYTIPEACGLLRMSRSALYRLIDRREIATVRFGRSRRITAGQLAEFVRRAEGQAPPALVSLAAKKETAR